MHYAPRTPRELEEFVGVLDAVWMFGCFLPAIICFNRLVPSESPEPRKLAAIMFMNMVGCNALRRWLVPRFNDLRFRKVWT